MNVQYFYLNPKLKIPSGFPIWFLIANNILPICGLLFFGWSVFDMMLFLIGEILVFGIFTIIKIICIKNEIIKPTKHTVTEKISSFGNSKTTTYEIITNDPIKIKIHAISVTFIILIMGLGMPTLGMFEEFSIAFNVEMLFFGIMPLLSHLVSFTKNYTLKKEYLHTQPEDLLHSFIFRVAPIMFIICLGIFFGKIGLLVLILVFRTIIDYRRHMKEHSVIYTK